MKKTYFYFNHFSFQKEILVGSLVIKENMEEETITPHIRAK